MSLRLRLRVHRGLSLVAGAEAPPRHGDRRPRGHDRRGVLPDQVGGGLAAGVLLAREPRADCRAMRLEPLDTPSHGHIGIRGPDSSVASESRIAFYRYTVRDHDTMFCSRGWRGSAVCSHTDGGAALSAPSLLRHPGGILHVWGVMLVASRLVSAFGALEWPLHSTGVAAQVSARISVRECAPARPMSDREGAGSVWPRYSSGSNHRRRRGL